MEPLALSLLVCTTVLAACLVAVIMLFARALFELSCSIDLAHMAPRSKPPWSVAHGNEYACFVSHYKKEAGSDARYIKVTHRAILLKHASRNSLSKESSPGSGAAG